MIDEWLGQRPSDFVRLPAFPWLDGVLEFTQQKTGAKVRLPVDLVPHLVERLAEDARLRAKQDVQALTLLTDERTGRVYTEQRFRDVFGRARAKVAEKDPTVADLRFRWLRNTAVTRLFDAGVAVGDICEVTGHSLNTAHQILDRYRVRTGAGAERAFRQRLQYEQTENKNLDKRLGQSRKPLK